MHCKKVHTAVLKQYVRIEISIVYTGPRWISDQPVTRQFALQKVRKYSARLNSEA